MARDASTVQSELDTLRSRMAKGIFRVRHGETETSYQTASDMLNAIKALEAELGKLAAAPIRQVRFQTDKGL